MSTPVFRHLEPSWSPPARWTAALVLWLGVAAPVAGIAQNSDDQRAKTREELSTDQKKSFLEFLQAANDAYAAGDYQDALPFYEKAYDILPKPIIHYRMALCHERLEEPKRALQYYRRFLEQKPESPKRGKIEKTIATLEKKVEQQSTARVKLRSDPPSARVFVRSGGAEKRELAPRGETPLTLTVVPGRVEITLEKEGYQTIRETVRVRAGETYNYQYTLLRAVSRRRSSNTVSLVATILGGAGALVGGTLYGIGLHCFENRKNCSRSLANTAAVGAYTGGGLGVVGLGTAAILGLVSPPRRPGHARRLELRLVVSPGVIGLSGRF